MARVIAAALIGLACTAASFAQSPPVRPRSMARTVSAAASLGGRGAALATVVSAFVWNGQNDPVKDVTVRLRNVHTGHVEGTTVSDADGRVTFTHIEEGTYVLEVMNAKGAVVATGQVFSVVPGETVATFVRLGSQLPWFAGIFNHAAAATVASAAALGATAVGVTGQAATPGR